MNFIENKLFGEFRESLLCRTIPFTESFKLCSSQDVTHNNAVSQDVTHKAQHAAQDDFMVICSHGKDSYAFQSAHKWRYILKLKSAWYCIDSWFLYNNYFTLKHALPVMVMFGES